MRRLVLLLGIALLPGCGGGDKAGGPLPSAPAAITLTSSAFSPGGTIPTRYTCSGAGISPPLRWSGVPRAARELTLVVEDPDAGRFVHWIVLAIPPATTRFGAARSGWKPPCPPKGDAPHHYVFALYATDAPLGLDKDASIDAVTKAAGEHAIARGELTGTFGR